jgi:CBS domain containing-hemolysin-like protein
LNPLPLFLFALFFLLGTACLTSLTAALRRIQKRHSKRELKALGNLFFYRPLHALLLPEHEYEGIFFSILTALNFCRFLTAVFITLFLLSAGVGVNVFLTIICFLVALVTAFTLSDYLPRLFGSRYAQQAIWIAAPLSSLYLILAIPFSYVLIKSSQKLMRSVSFDYLHEPLAEGKQEVYEIIQESDIDTKLEPHDKKLIESVISFQDLIAREIMVPRVDLFSLPIDTTIKVAAKRLQEEGYSRTPVYKGTIDQIAGLLMYKDILVKYMEAEEKKDPHILNQSIETIVKPVLYTPETKRISHLLQEFRKRQMHLAIVVDEYGGTEGIVTIEDILEVLVGDIEDEYDTEEEEYTRLSDGSFIVDPRMSIIDVEEQFDIRIPEEGDYDTLGGYIFHRAGEIPPKGFLIKQDNFELEVLRVSDRSIEKVKIKIFNNPT